MSAGHEPFELGVHDRPVPPPTTSHVSRLGRLVNIAQLLGALVAVPAGIGSAYTMYKANFSEEATCQSLRSNIIAMLDRRVDASARRILVRRDVESFERSCGAVDPETTAAFKTLLSADKAPAAAWATPQQAQQPQTAARTAEPPPAKAEAPKSETPKSETPKSETPKSEPPKSEPVHTVKAEPAPVKTKPPAERTAAVATAPAQSEAPVSDAAWVAAVRGALVKHERETATASISSAPVSLAPPPHPLGEMPAPQTLMPAQPAPTALAPTLPPPSVVGVTPAPQADPDHPVPPSAIPEQQMQEAKKRSRMGELVEDIPFFGKSLADKVWR